MNHKSLKALGLLLATLLLIGCEDIPSPPGIYFAHYGTATECLEVSPSHVYRQVLMQNGVILYDNKGIWHDRTDGNKGVVFYDFIVATDLWPNTLPRNTTVNTPPFTLEKVTSAVSTLSDWDFIKREKVITMRGDVTFFETDKKSTIQKAEQFVQENQLKGR